MPLHSTSRLQLMPPTQNRSSSTSLVQMRANTHVSSSVTDVVDILDVNYDDLFCDYNTLIEMPVKNQLQGMLAVFEPLDRAQSKKNFEPSFVKIG